MPLDFSQKKLLIGLVDMMKALQVLKIGICRTD